MVSLELPMMSSHKQLKRFNQPDSTSTDRFLRSRQGFTLLELMLVLAILAIMAGLAIPTLDSMITSRRLIQSIERLQNELLEARVTAMKTGQAQVFRATIQGSGYSITPWLSGNESQDASAGATVMTQGGVIQTERTNSGQVATSGIDTSGSVSDSQLSEFLGVLRSIVCSYPSVRCRLYYADSQCVGPFEVDINRPLASAVGGGGTDFRPFFAAVATRVAADGAHSNA